MYRSSTLSRRPWFWLLSLVLLPLTVAADPVMIKFATLAPEGTPWMTLMQDMNEEIKQQSNGQLSFRFYPGGIAGDERDVIRKMRINQLHGGAFSGFGLGEIVPELRVLELPQLFRDAAEADYVSSALFDHFTEAFAQKGYILLSLNEAGAVHLFSQVPLQSRDDMAGAKIWTWQGDPLPLEIFKAYGIPPVPLAIPDVLPSLQSGLITACYGPPLVVLALQWFSKVHYYSAAPITHAIGALLLTEHQWTQLTPEQQTLLRQMVTTYNAKAVTMMRGYHDKAFTLLRSLGLKEVSMPEAEQIRLQQLSAHVRETLTGKLYSQQFLDRVIELRDHYRQTHP